MPYPIPAPLPVPKATAATPPLCTPAYSALPECREFARLCTAGSTTRPDAITVLWLGEHLVLVQRKGEKHFESRGHQAYARATYTAMDRHRAGYRMGLDVVSGLDLLPPGIALTKGEKTPEGVSAMRSEVWVETMFWSRGKETEAMLRAWVEKLATLDAAFAERAQAAYNREWEKERREEAERKAERKAERAAAKLAKAAPAMAEALRKGILSLAHTLADRPAAQAEHLTVRDVLAGRRPDGAMGAWTTLRLMIEAAEAAGLPPVADENDRTAWPVTSREAPVEPPARPEGK